MRAWLTALLLMAGAALAPGGLPAQELQAVPRFEEKAPGQRFKRQMSGIETCLACHGSFNIIEHQLPPREPSPGEQEGDTGEPVTERSLWIDSGMFLESVHARLGCTGCHTGIDEAGHRLKLPGAGARQGCMPCHEEAVVDPEEKLPDETPALVGIADDRRVVTDALKACINCHPGEYLEYKDSIHGVDVLENLEREPPFCIDCHGSHYILHKDDERSWTNPANVPHTCLKCHGEATIQQRFGLTKDVAGTFEESFHGKRGQVGGNVAVCVNCHGSHEIYASTDPRSKVNALRVAATCGECHEGAQLSFAAAFTHGKVSRTELTGLYAIVQAHKWMIVGVITPLMFIVFMDLARMLRERRLKARAR